MIKLRYTQRFAKALKKLTNKEQRLVYNKLTIFQDNPYHPSLRTKKIKGMDVFEFSVNMDIRIIRRYEDEELIILLLDVGHHKDILGV